MSDLQKNLKEAIFNVMEQMFFFLPDEETAQGSPDIDVYIGITGDPQYLISLFFDKMLAGRMATNLLGMENFDLDDETVRKNLQEAANIIGGRFLLSFENSENRNVTLPSLDHSKIFPGSSPIEAVELTVSYDSCPLRAKIEVVK